MRTSSARLSMAPSESEGAGTYRWPVPSPPGCLPGRAAQPARAAQTARVIHSAGSGAVGGAGRLLSPARSAVEDGQQPTGLAVERVRAVLTLVEELEQPVERERPPDKQNPFALRPGELEAAEQRSGLDAGVVPDGQVLGERRQLVCPVAAARVLEVAQPDPLAVPQVVGQIPVALAED